VCSSIFRALLLRYRAKKEKEEAEVFQWQQQSTETPTDSQEPQVQQAQAAEVAQRVVDRGIKDAALKGSSSTRPTVMVYEMKRLERLEVVGSSSKLDVLAIWNGGPAPSAAVRANVLGAIAQVNRYASLHGCRFGAFGTYRYNWFVAFQGDNTLKIAGPYKHDCSNPTILQVMHFLSCQAIEEPALSSWTHLEDHPHGRGGSRPSSRPSSRRGSRSEPDPPMPDAQSGGSSGSGQPFKRQRGDGGSGGKAAATCASNDHQADQLQERDQLPDSQGAADEQHAAASVLSGAAAGLCHRAVEKVIGHGISGPVFLHRLGSTGGGTTAVALKLAPWPSQQAQALAREGSVLLAIMPLWGRYVPPLLALGRGQGGRSFMLATRYLQGRHLDPAHDEHLAPQLALAVEQLHGLGVAHCDLRPENVMVVQEEGQERVWLIDFGHARQGAQEDEFQRDIAALTELFQG